jgi:hypothetical protein
MGLTANSVVYAQDFRDISSTKELSLGTKGVTRDGRIYRYSLAGAVALAPGKICINADLVANHTNQAVQAAATVGATEVSVTLGATAATADQYKDGYLVINDADGEGINYLINGHAAHAGSGTLVVNLVDPIEVALTTSSEYTLKANTWAGVVISIADQADQCVGVPNVAVTAAYYAWLQTGGECSVLADEAVAKGLALTIGSSTVGAVEALDAAGEYQIGVASEALVDTEYRSAYLTIDQ